MAGDKNKRTLRNTCCGSRGRWAAPKGKIMTSNVLVSEMVAAVERERIDGFARSSRGFWMAQAGREVGQLGRARKLLSVVFQRAGRPQGRGTAPAGGPQPQIETVA